MKRIESFITNEDMELFHAQCGVFFSKPEKFPVSYRYGGVTYTGFPKNTVVKKRFLDGNMLEITLEGTLDSGLILKAECTEYRDYPALEWTVYASSANPEALLEDFNGADIVFNGPGPVLVSNNGDFCSADGYTPGKTILKEGVSFTQAPAGGRPCDHAFPYQRLLFDTWGVSIAIGWPGQWKCAWKGLKSGVSFTAGQEVVRTRLKKNEVFRTPRMALVYFRGGEERGVNVWRRWYKAHVLPRCRGNPIKPSVSFSDNNNGVEFLSATEENQIRGLEWFKKNIKVKGEGFWWIDAGWYIAKNNKGEPEWPVTGTWKPDPERFSRGLSPVGKAAKEAGLNFLVWFEPERVRPGTQLAEDHPEWLLKLKETKAPENMLLNLANPECLAWICETILKLIRDSGIRWYRQDFNFEPLRYWRDNEAPDRQGMLENLYVQGYLKFWDYLLTSEPGLAIDSCASGGRRNDLETMRRSVPLHPTDYGYGYHHINQSFRHTLYEWIPYTRSWFGSWDKNNEYYDHTNYYQADEPSFDNFIMVNSFGVFLGGFSTAAIESCGAEAAAYVNKMLDVFTDFSEIALNGDFYALTENHRDFTKWTVFQFNWPEKNKGVIQALRNNKSPEASIKVQLRGIDNERRYRFINKETGEAFEIDGNRIFAEGLTFTQPVRSGAIWLYFGI